MAVPPTADVPCGTCNLCCKMQEVFVHATFGDDPPLYRTERAWNRELGGWALRLRHKPNGDCIHLGENGCEVYAHRPAMCRVFDCREHYFLPAAERRRREAKFGPNSIAVARRGRELVEQSK